MADEEAPKKPVDVPEIIMIMVEQMASIAWAKLGLQPDPLTGTLDTDLEQAKMAIDSVSALAPILEGDLADDDRRQVQNMVRDLKLNYVKKSSESN